MGSTCKNSDRAEVTTNDLDTHKAPIFMEQDSLFRQNRKTDMQETTGMQTGNVPLLVPKPKHQGLRTSFSEGLYNGDQYELIMAGSSDDAAETVWCACCNVPEDCTAAYIRRVRAAHCGSWVCGLCAEAVGEQLRREPGAGVDAALRWHMAVCRDFNATTRLNPKLSLAGSMRDIARRSFNRRTSSTTTCHDELRAANKTMARTISCQPHFFA